MRIANSSSIDFAFWILLVDGLKASPFDKHPQGNQVLSNLGMDAPCWYKWLQLLLIGQDDRLWWHVENIEQSAKKEATSLRRMLELPGIEHNIVSDDNLGRSEYELYFQQLTEQEQEYQKAVEYYQQQGINLRIIQEADPPELWQGSLDIQNVLNQWWEEYQGMKYSNQTIKDFDYFYFLTDNKNNDEEFWKVYFVDYPYEAELFIAPIFGVIAVPDCQINYESLQRRLESLKARSW